MRHASYMCPAASTFLHWLLSLVVLGAATAAAAGPTDQLAWNYLRSSAHGRHLLGPTKEALAHIADGSAAHPVQVAPILPYNPKCFGTNGKVVFMFLLRGDHNVPKVWEAFFRGCPAGSYIIKAHAMHPEEVVTPLFRKALLPEVYPTSWTDPNPAVNRLMEAGYAEHELACKFFLLSESCLPLRDCCSIVRDSLRDRKSFFFKMSAMWPADKRQIPPEDNAWLKQAGGGFKHAQWIMLTRPQVDTILRTEDHYAATFHDVPFPSEMQYGNTLLMESARWAAANGERGASSDESGSAAALHKRKHTSTSVWKTALPPDMRVRSVAFRRVRQGPGQPVLRRQEHYAPDFCMTYETRANSDKPHPDVHVQIPDKAKNGPCFFMRKVDKTFQVPSWLWERLKTSPETDPKCKRGVVPPPPAPAPKRLTNSKY
eukprot:jgi/Mesvir1/862/Mv17433-RA.1